MTIYEITPDGYNTILESKQLIKQDVDNVSDYFVQRKPFEITDDGVNRVAHIHVFGPLLRNASEFEKQTGITTYSQIIEELNMSKDVDYVLLHVDSPGGSAMGSEEASTAIMNHPVPIYGIVDGIAASAAYKLISSCTQIYSTVSSEIGSIGSIVVITSQKASMNSMGIYNNIFVNSEAKMIKSIGHDFGDLTEEQSAIIQNKVEQSGKRFQEFVKQNRPEINPIVFNADMYRAEESIRLGLIDGIIN